MARIKSVRSLRETRIGEIEKLREEKPDDFKTWMPTKCIVRICEILEGCVFEKNDAKTRRYVRVRIRRVLDEYDLERTRIKCDQENCAGSRLNVEIHKPSAKDDDFMKIQLSYTGWKK
jgi:hypothetical protein